MTTDVTADLVLAQWNIHDGAWGRPEDPDADRLPEIIAVLEAVGADLLVLNEIRDQRDYNAGRAHPSDHYPGGCPADRDRMAAVEAGLGLRLAEITRSRSGIPSAVLYRPDQVKLLGWHDRHDYQFDNGCGIAAFGVDGLDQPLSVAAIHASVWGPDRGRGELAAAATMLSDAGRYGLLVGDLNCPASTDTPVTVDVEAFEDHHRANLLVDPDAADPVLDDRTARLLEDRYRLVDLAARTGMTGPTGMTGRVDRAYARPALADIAVDAWRPGHAPGLSDHRPVAYRLNLGRARRP